MSDIEREDRKKQTQEYFTQHREIGEILSHWSHEEILRNETFLDSSCGSGNILKAVLQCKLDVGIKIEDALSTLYGVDLMIDNVDLCRERLLCGREDLRHIVEKNIVCADGLKYKYDFKPMTDKMREKEEKIRIKNYKEKEKALKVEQERIEKERKDKELKKSLGSNQFGIKLQPKAKKLKSVPVDISCL